MLRLAILSLCLLTPLAPLPAAMAQQTGNSGLPAPGTAKAWHRAVQMRLNANMAARVQANRAVGGLAKESIAVLGMEIAADGGIRRSWIAKSTGTPADDETLLRAAAELPRMPAFPADMQRDSIEIVFPIKLAP